MESSVLPPSVLDCCLVLLYVQQNFFNLEEFPDGLRAEASEIHTSLWNHRVQQQVCINEDIIVLSSCWHQELTVFQQVCTMPRTLTDL